MTDGGKTTTNFNKLAGAKPQMRKAPATEADRQAMLERVFPNVELRKEYEAGDAATRNLIVAEQILEKLAAPIRAERAEKIAAVLDENARLKKCLDVMNCEIDALATNVAAYVSARDSAAAAPLHQDARGAVSAFLKKAEHNISTIEAALQNAGVAEVGELSKTPFLALTDGLRKAFAFDTDFSSAWSIPPATQVH